MLKYGDVEIPGELIEDEKGYIVNLTLLKQAEKWLQRGLDLLFPPVCVICQRRGSWLCTACVQRMQPLTVPVCQRCGTPLSFSGASCTFCQRRFLQLHGLRFAQFYRGTVRRAIHALKYDGQKRLAEPLGLLLAQAFKHYRMHADAIIPLPLHIQRQQARGYNQAELLARICARHLKIPCLDKLIIRRRATRAQVGLNSRERRQNVEGAFELASSFPTRSLAGCTLLLIDDVCTTGATLEACASPLYQVGIQEIWGLVLAKPDGQAQII